MDGTQPVTLRIATRGSPLAMAQAKEVAAQLHSSTPAITTEFVVVATRGDEDQSSSLERIGGQGVFVKEVQQALLEGRADLAVHSAKDLPSSDVGGLVIAAVPRRNDPRDGLVGTPFPTLGVGAVVGTGSPRRKALLLSIRPDLEIIDVRGNMARRVGMVEEGQADAVVVAVAAMNRLGWTTRLGHVFSPEEFCPQVGQGALAIECCDDSPFGTLLTKLDDPSSHRCLRAERAFLHSFGGSCSEPVGAYALESGGGNIVIQGIAAVTDGTFRIAFHDCIGTTPELVGAALAKSLIADVKAGNETDPRERGSAL